MFLVMILAIGEAGFIDNTVQFTEGVLYGMRGNKDVASGCVQQAQSFEQPLKEMLETIESIIRGEIVDTFELAVNANSLLNQVVAIITACSLRTLDQKWEELFTTDGFGRALFNVATNYEESAKDYANFIDDLALGYFNSAGISLGKLISIVLNFYF